MDIVQSTDFWIGLVKIIWINIILSGDNAVVIAMAARALPPHQQKKAIFWGSAAAIVMRIGLTVIALEMLQWQFLKIVGGLALLYIGIQLLLEEDDGEDDGGGATNGSLITAIRTILIADLVMSLDNVLAVAAAAKGNIPLPVAGLAISIPLIITAGAALLGFLAGEMLVTDPAVTARFGPQSALVQDVAGVIGAVLVVAVGLTLQRRREAAHAARKSV